MTKDINDKTYAKTMGRTICEVHRELYDTLDKCFSDHEEFDGMMDKLQEAYSMAKKMDAKLRQYANNYDDGWWEKEKKSVVNEKIKTRKKRNMTK